MAPDLSQSPWGPSLRDGDKVFPGWLQNVLFGYGGGAEEEGWLFRTRMEGSTFVGDSGHRKLMSDVQRC